jgi:hypothetical protein
VVAFRLLEGWRRMEELMGIYGQFQLTSSKSTLRFERKG